MAPRQPSPGSDEGLLMERGNITVVREQAIDHEQRRHDDTTTWLAETLDGGMRSTFEYRFAGGELYARDDSAMGVVFDDSERDAEKLVAAKPNLYFELRRRRIEKGEYQDMLAMMRGELPNTIVVESDFPPELMQATEDVGGYNVTRKQTMLRVITRTEDGRLVMQSQSLDGSNRRALAAIRTALGFGTEPGELLGQRMHLELTAEQQTALIDRLVGIYDRSLQQQYGGRWYAGRPGHKRQNTYDFVCSQHDLLNAYYVATEYSGNRDRLLYGLAAAMRERYEGRAMKKVWNLLSSGHVEIPGVPQEYVAGQQRNALYEIMSAGERSRQEGRVFSGCGASLGGEAGVPGAANELRQAGYGNKTDEKESYKFDKYTYCVVCQAPPKEGESKKLCGPCGICRSCDKILHIKQAA